MFNVLQPQFRVTDVDRRGEKIHDQPESILFQVVLYISQIQIM